MMTHQGDLLENYQKMQLIMKLLKSHKGISDFSKHKNFGYVNTRIADLGCGMQVSVVANLNHTYEHTPDFAKEVEKKFDVTVMKMETLRKKKTFIIHNNKQLGVTEE